MNHLVSSFCLGKYAPLVDYVKDITILDLTRLKNHEIINSIPSQYQLLIKLFLKDCNIEKILTWSASPSIPFNYDENNEEDDDENYNSFINNYAPYENLSKIEDTNILNLCNKISSALYKSSVNITNVHEILSKIGKKSYTYLDFSWNKLYDNDLTYIVNAIKESDIDVKAISLSCNSISGYNMKNRPITDANLHYLLEKCEYVDISMNPLVTVDRKDFFKSLEQNNPSFLLYLIWIPEMWLKSKAWHGMICKELHDEVRDLHRQYYRWVRTLPLD